MEPSSAMRGVEMLHVNLVSSGLSPIEDGCYVLVTTSAHALAIRRCPEWSAWHQTRKPEIQLAGEVGVIEKFIIVEVSDKYLQSYGAPEAFIITKEATVVLGSKHNPYSALSALRKN